MDKRLKALRKELNMTQQEFADKIGIARGNISSYEVGKNAISNAVISLICKTDFSKGKVNENWLRNGNGDMFIVPSTDEKLRQAFESLNSQNDSFKKQLITELLMMDEKGWDALNIFLHELRKKG